MRRIFTLKYGGLACAYLASMSYVQADISGKAFRDFNSNGSFDSSASFNEIGEAGITVKAFDVTGAQVGATATSAANGNYTLTGLSTGADYRVEFSWSDSKLRPSVAGGTTVQFVADGATNVNVALSKPNDYSQANPDVVTSIMVLGPTNGETAPGVNFSGLSALVKFPYTAQGEPINTAGYVAPTVLARHQDIGSTFGLAYHRPTGDLFASAFYKRASGFGPGGSGAIYRISSTGAISVHATIPNTGAALHDFAASGAYNDVNYDLAPYSTIAKESLGDLEMSADGTSLFTVNLNDQHLYQVATSTGAVSDLGEIARPAACVNALDFRPFALGKDENDTLYIGAVCSNESQTEPSGHPLALLLRYEGSGSFTPVFSFDLQFGDVYNDPTRPYWSSWTPTGGYLPLFSDLLFSGKDLIMSFRNIGLDRYYNPGSSVPPIGEVLKACWSGAGWDLENNGVCGGQLGALPNFNATNPRQVDSGPGGGHFFQMTDMFNEQGIKGGLAGAPGYHSLLVTTTDPYVQISGGVMHLDRSSGLKSQRYEVYRGAPDDNLFNLTAAIDGYFGKSNGMGDVELMSNPAPVEVGNRVWRDTDADGIQDAAEAGINDVDVVLTCGSNTATAKTANGGVYLFSTATNASFMQAGGSCSISIAGSQTVLSGLSVTVQNKEGATDNNALTDIRDSDADSAGLISFTVGAAGENNHSLDVGYITPLLSDLKLVKTINTATAKRGDTVSYTLTLTNESTTAATGVAVKDVLPTEMSYLSQSGDGAYDPSTGVWTLGDVAGSATKQLIITVTIQ